MVATDPARAFQRGNRDAKIADRVSRKLQHFQLLPDDALIDIRVVSALIGRSRASIYRDVKHGRLAHPVKFAHSTRWRAGDIRNLIEHLSKRGEVAS